MPSKLIIIVIEYMNLDLYIFWAHVGAHFNPPPTVRAKMSLSRAQNIFMPVNIDSIVLLKFGSLNTVVPELIGRGDLRSSNLDTLLH